MLRIYIAIYNFDFKYRQVLRSVTFILLVIFLVLVSEKSDKRPQNVAQVAVCRHSEHHSVHWMSTSAVELQIVIPPRVPVDYLC